MSVLSEVTILIAERASDLEKAREVFTAEIRAFSAGILGGIKRVRSEPWSSGRVRIDMPREIETEARATGFFNSQFAIGRAALRFKKGTLFTVISDVKFGIEFDEATEAFVWQVVLVPAARYQRVDDLVWAQWRSLPSFSTFPKSAHKDRDNIVVFVSRPLSAELKPEVAFNDVKTVFELLMTAHSAIGEAVGVDPLPGDELAEQTA
jgi:hypothetical protein